MFSIIFAAGTLFFLINLILVRLKGRAVFGQLHKAGTPEHKRFMQIAGTRNLIIATIIFLFLLAHLIWIISVILNVNTPSAHALLIIVPAFIAIITIACIPSFRKLSKDFGYNNASISPGKKKRKHTSKDDSSWLS